MSGQRVVRMLLAWMVVVASACLAPPPPSEVAAAEEPAAGMMPEVVRIEASALEGLGLTYAVAEVRELTPALELPAEIVAVPDRVALVVPPAAGRITAVLANEGDEIQRGDLLATLASTEVGAARAEVLAARARADVARKAAQRASTLQLERVGSQRAAEEAAAQLAIADAELQTALARLQIYGVSAEVPDNGDPASISLAAPIAGTIVTRVASIGQWAETTDRLFEIVRLDTLWVLAMVYERELRYVQPGQDVLIQVRAFPGEVFAGRVDQVSGQLDAATRTAQVRVVLPNASRRLRPGMFASARIQGTHAHEPRPLLTVPWAAMQEVDGHHIVFVRVDDGVFEPRRIHTGEQSGELVEVLSGLQAGDQVVVDGSVLLKAQLLRATLGEEE